MPITNSTDVNVNPSGLADYTLFAPQQIRPLLEALSRSDAVIVGGQAINLWSETYQKKEEPWRQDLDPKRLSQHQQVAGLGDNDPVTWKVWNRE
ncbi:MAG: hypothetical protein FJ387_18215 [Verrucomicrobia bacterium]|nr:hypothetical protein [Verrucomicrobiota bacterium]